MGRILILMMSIMFINLTIGKVKSFNQLIGHNALRKIYAIYTVGN